MVQFSAGHLPPGPALAAFVFGVLRSDLVLWLGRKPQIGKAVKTEGLINICLGSAIATVGLTVPAILLIGLATKQTVVLGLGEVDSVLLMVTILISAVTFSSRKTNIIHRIVHLILFAVYIEMIFD